MASDVQEERADKYVDRWEVLDELLCLWIDGRRMKLDDERTMQLITPRRVEHWSGRTRNVWRLEQEGRMQPSDRKCQARKGVWTGTF